MVPQGLSQVTLGRIDFLDTPVMSSFLGQENQQGRRWGLACMGAEQHSPGLPRWA